MTAPKPLTDAEKAQILALHADGHSCRAIARETGRSFTACAKVVRDAGRATKTGQTADPLIPASARPADNKIASIRRFDLLFKYPHLLKTLISTVS